MLVPVEGGGVGRGVPPLAGAALDGREGGGRLDSYGAAVLADLHSEQ